jgi:hypothetical protein
MSATNRRRTPKILDAPATLADYANFSFQPVKKELTPPSRKVWLECAGDEYATFRFALAVLDKTDIELAAAVEAAGADLMLDLHKEFDALGEKYKAGLKVLGSAQTRLLCALARTASEPAEAAARDQLPVLEGA